MKMEVLELINNIKKGFATVIRRDFESISFHESLYWLYVPLFMALLSAVVFVARRRHIKAAVKEGEVPPTPGVRFRKRDKALFYGRKMLRKVKSISDNVPGQGRKRKIVMRFARKLLRLKKDVTPIELKVLEPPAEYMEEELLNDSSMPLDVLYMLQSIRVFGHFEKPVFLKLCKHCEILNVSVNQFLFKIGDADENVFIVQSGKLNVFITCQDGSNLTLKIVKPGESVTSLLSFTDVLVGRPNAYKTVSAKALEESTIVKLPMAAFQEIFEEYPDIFIRVIQVIMVRLQRVTFTALHEYLGLSAELMQGHSGSSFKSTRRKSVVLNSPSKAGKVPLGDEDIPVGGYYRDDSYHQYDLSDINIPSLVHVQNPSKKSHQTSQAYPQFPTAQSAMQPPKTLNRFTTSSGGGNTPTVSLPIQQQQLLQPPSVNGTSSIPVPLSSSAPPDFCDINAAEKGSAPQRKKAVEVDASALTVATEGFVKLLGLDDRSLIEGKLELREFQVGTYLMKEESNKDVALIYLVSGMLLMSQKTTDTEEEVHIFTVYPGEVVGGLAVLTGEASFFTIRAKHVSVIAQLSKNTFYSIVKEKPTVLLNVAYSVIQRLSPFVRQVDFALDWVFLESGRALYRQGDDSDSTFIVLSGRLRSVIRHANGKKEVVGEYGRGDLVGVVEMVTHTSRGTTVMAVRDSELAKLPEGLFDAIKLRFPIVVTRLINLLGHRILGSWKNPSFSRMNLRGETRSSAVESRPTQLNFSTVAIVPVSDDVPLTAFTYELHHCLSVIGPTIRLTSDVIRKTLGSSILDHNNEYRLTSWLAQQEDQHKIALYQCDMTFSSWTQRCIRQADCILIIGLGENTPTIGKVEKEVERLAIRTQKELVLLHREGGPRPQNTIMWLNMRSWVSTHHHIQCSKRMFIRRSQYRINELYSKILTSEPNIHSDFSRLARWLTGTSVGLVLGGGGARGAAHVGMIKAIQEAGIPIDMVGGVSIGAFMGALWCSEKNITTVTQKAREWSVTMTHWWRQLFDLTYPVTSMFSGKDFNKTIHSTFGDTYIEDLWLPYFTVTTDITASCMRLHCHGSLWRYVRASMSLSGYMPPLCDPVDGHLLLDGGYVNNLPGQMWRYIRASMSIVGILPPVCDPKDGHLLVDGCYTNNVPADVMRGLGAHHIFAVDVGSVDETDLTNYGDDLSGWWLLWKKYNPFTKQVKVPNLPDIQSRLAYVSCVRQLEEVKSSDYCEYIRPPIDKYRTLQFGSFDEIKNVGYEHGKQYFETRRNSSGNLPTSSSMQCTSNLKPLSLSAYNFTDLTQLVCKAPRQCDYDISSASSSAEEDDYEENQAEGYASEPSVGVTESSKPTLIRRRAGSLSLSENECESEGEFVKKNL